MIPSEILKKAITKAFKNGFVKEIGVSATHTAPAEFHSIQSHIINWTAGKYEGLFTQDVCDLIFNPDFAKALWPWDENAKCPYCKISFPGSLMHPVPCPLANNFYPSLWQYHLQQLVIAADPIKYLGENI